MPKPKPSMLVRALVGPAGEHYVLFRLYRLGLMAALAPPGAPDVDVLVLTPDQEVAAQVQVKTRTYGTDKGWHMKPKHERLVDDRLIYAFVDLEPESAPVTYVIPSAVVADVLASSHQAWLAAPGAKGRVHKDSNMRRLLPAYKPGMPDYPHGWLDRYVERWDILRNFATGLSTHRAGA